MKVRCTKLKARHSEFPNRNGDGWLTIGRDYVVLEVYGRPSGVEYRLIGDDGLTPAIHSAEQFEIISPEIPNGWIFQMRADLSWVLRPFAWAEQSFWASYFDGDASAQSTFNRTVSELGVERT
jgi:hypothetical protein